MRYYHFKVFEKNDHELILLFTSPDGSTICEHSVATAEIEQFICEMEKDYDSLIGSGINWLTQAGQRLYNWLDGATEHWLEREMRKSNDFAIQIDVTKGLRHLPWELLHAHGQFLCANRPFSVIRWVNNISYSFEQQNRPLRMLFMAFSPEDVLPVLNYEAEERGILEVCRKSGIELVVEESGNLLGLEEQIRLREDSFDVLHFTGHAGIDGKETCFCMEDDLGYEHRVSASEIAKVFSGKWPKLIFLSGCDTAQAADKGNLPSLSEALVAVGAPAVLGWALPVSDHHASFTAAELYARIAGGMKIDEAVVQTRKMLHEKELECWHYLRLYTNATRMTACVTPPETPEREKLLIKAVDKEFLDAGSKVEVCRRENFVGKRRPIQRCLRVLRSQQGETDYAEGVLLHGMAGLGKSSLAARLCERMETHERLVWVGKLNEAGFIKRLSEKLDSHKVNAILNQSGLDLTQKLRYVFENPWKDRPILFILDDFEDNLQICPDGRCQLLPVAQYIFHELLTAIRDYASVCRVVVTSKYMFSLTEPMHLYSEGLESMRGADLEKKFANLLVFYREGKIDEEFLEQVKVSASGNPRLLERLSKVLEDSQTPCDQIMRKIEKTVEEFRKEILLKELLSQQEKECRWLLALMMIYELPVMLDGIRAIKGEKKYIDKCLDNAVALGLVESGKNPADYSAQYFVSRILEPLVRNEISAEERIRACREGAKWLYKTVWDQNQFTSIDFEIHRLAIHGKEKEIAVEVGSFIAQSLTEISCYHAVEEICLSTLRIGEDYRILFHLGRVRKFLGNIKNAQEHLERALALYSDLDQAEKYKIGNAHVLIRSELADHYALHGEVRKAMELWEDLLVVSKQMGDIKSKAAILNNMAIYIARQGEIKRAMELWEESLTVSEQLGDIQGMAATLNNMAIYIAQQGEINKAMELWKESLVLLEQMGNIEGKAATLNNMAEHIAEQGDVKRAMELYGESLTLNEQIGDIQSKAVTLHLMAIFRARQGEVKQAMKLWEESLTIWEQIGDIKNKSATLHQIARYTAQQGEIKRAMELWEESLALDEQVGDKRGKAVTLINIAGYIAQQGDVKKALELFEESLTILEQVGDIRGKAETLHEIAIYKAKQGEVKRAMELWRESFGLFEQIGNIKGKAEILSIIAQYYAQQGDVKKAMELSEESLALNEQIGDINGKAVILNNIALYKAQLGEVERAMELWEESLALNEQIGELKSKAVAMDNMALYKAQGGEIERAMELWEESLAINEEIGDKDSRATTLNNMAIYKAEQGEVKKAKEFLEESHGIFKQMGNLGGQAATLAQMAWLAWKQGDNQHANQLNLAAANFFAQTGEVINLITVLRNIGICGSHGNPLQYLAQAFFLAIHVQLPIDSVLALATSLSKSLGCEHPLSLLIAAYMNLLTQTSGKKSGNQEEIQQLSSSLVSQCASMRETEKETLHDWTISGKLNDPKYVQTALVQGLFEIVDEWIYDPWEFIHKDK